MVDVAIGKDTAVDVFALQVIAIIRPQQVLFGPLQLRLGEAVLTHPFDLGQQGLHPGQHLTGRNLSLQRIGLGRPRQILALCPGIEKRRVRFATNLLQPAV